MSIATRIQAMEEHIADAYDSLSKFGVAAPSNKNIENIASLVDEIYDNTPKTDYASGTDLTLENTRVGKIDFKDTDTIEKIALGATSQQTYIGKNLLHNVGTSGSSNGITWTKNSDGTVKVDGTATADVSFYISGSLTLESGSYILSGCPSGGNSSTYSMVLEGVARDVGSGKTFTSVTNRKVAIEVKNGTTCDNLIFQPQIEIGSTATSFEPWIVSPNPNSPQDINVVRGNQNIIIKGKNINSATLESGNISNGADIVDSNVLRSKEFIPIIPNTAYLFSINNTLNRVVVSMYDKNKSFLNNDGTNGHVSTSGKFTTYSDAYYIRYRCYSADKSLFETGNIQIEKGTTTPTEYTPYQENNYEINLSSKNLFDKDDSNLIMNNIYINASGYKLQAANGMKTICISCEPNTTYVVSKIASARFVIGTASDKTTGTLMTVGRNTTTATELTLTSGANDKYLFVFYYHGSADTLTEETIRNSIQIEVGSTATNYVPYFNIELYKIENNQDYIYKTSGKNLFNENNYLSNAGISYSTIVTSNNNNLFYMPVQYGKNYIISFIDNGVSGNILYGFSNDVPVMGGTCTYNVLDITTLNNYVFTPVNENNKYLCIRLNVNATNQYKSMKNIQVEVGDVATTYEPCGKDNWYWHEENYKIKLSSTNQTWINTTTNTSGIARYRTDDYIDIIKKVSSATVIGNILCNYYNPQIAGTAGSYGGNQGIAIDNVGAIFINDNTYSQNFAGWKEWLDSVDCYICFSLATPIETQITDETLISQLNAWYNAQSMDDITYITADGDLPIQLKLRALKK